MTTPDSPTPPPEADHPTDAGVAVAHHNVALLRTRDAGGIDALLADDELRGLIWYRIDDRSALVDPERIGRLRRRLLKIGLHPLFAEAIDDA
ncbi:MAG: hypothetical protein EA398_13745 [Deltaproteobacteria bacterium]|nr:MAG: hypothetical protein EA398_13745 [Deltaproteobacteria bacterium]